MSKLVCPVLAREVGRSEGTQKGTHYHPAHGRIFDLALVTGEVALPFQHMEAEARFGASIFWTRRSGAIGGEQVMVEYWQVRREGGRRGIVEIVREES